MIIKNSINELAVFGGDPVFKETLHVGAPNIGNRDNFFKRVNNIFDRNWLTNNGPLVQEFERKIEEFIGVKHCIAMANGTIALEIAIRALEMNGEVIVPSFTFIATVHALKWQGIDPVFCDIDERTHNIDPEKIESLITQDTTGIIATHIWGRPCNIEFLADIANRNNLKLIFDAAHAFGCSYKGKMIGQFGNAEVFSFHATKFFNTLEGGAVVTNNDSLAKKIRLMKNFGFSKMDNVVYIGTNGKMNEISAAMGLTSFESIDKLISKNRSNYNLYENLLSNITGLKTIKYDLKEKNNFQYIVIEINEEKFGVTRDVVLNILHQENIRTRRYFFPGCHNMEPYSSTISADNYYLPKTDELTKKVLLLPTGNSVGENKIHMINSIFEFIHNNADEINKKYFL